MATPQITIIIPETDGGLGGEPGIGGVQNSAETGAPGLGHGAHMSTSDSTSLAKAYPDSPVWGAQNANSSDAIVDPPSIVYDPKAFFINAIQATNGESVLVGALQGSFVDFPEGVRLNYADNMKLVPHEVPKVIGPDNPGAPAGGFHPQLNSPGAVIGEHGATVTSGVWPGALTSPSTVIGVPNNSPGTGRPVHAIDNRQEAERMRENSRIGDYIMGSSPATEDFDQKAGGH